MKTAISIYEGGLLFDADTADYCSSRERGLICPFCKEAVFLCREHERQGVRVAASWKHYKLSLNSAYCENRALSKEGLKSLEQLQPKARGQRIRLFNRKFWEIFKYQKEFPPLQKTCLSVMSEQELKNIVKHCRERWNVPEIFAAIPLKIEALHKDLTEENIRKHPAMLEYAYIASKHLDRAIAKVIEDFSKQDFSVLRLKILGEAIEWLGTQSATSSFEKLIMLAFIDCLEVFDLPIHTNDIANMAVSLLVLTDWEAAIARASKRGVGFGCG